MNTKQRIEKLEILKDAINTKSINMIAYNCIAEKINEVIDLIERENSRLEGECECGCHKSPHSDENMKKNGCDLCYQDEAHTPPKGITTGQVISNSLDTGELNGSQPCTHQNRVGNSCVNCSKNNVEDTQDSGWEEKLMDEFCVTFERANDESVVERLENFIHQEKAKSYEEGKKATILYKHVKIAIEKEVTNQALDKAIEVAESENGENGGVFWINGVMVVEWLKLKQKLIGMKK